MSLEELATWNFLPLEECDCWMGIGSKIVLEWAQESPAEMSLIDEPVKELRAGKTLLVGFNEEAYEEVFGG